jgi:hypothetical protein
MRAPRWRQRQFVSSNQLGGFSTFSGAGFSLLATLLFLLGSWFILQSPVYDPHSTTVIITILITGVAVVS